jgi:hypothetical protein
VIVIGPPLVVFADDDGELELLLHAETTAVMSAIPATQPDIKARLMIIHLLYN